MRPRSPGHRSRHHGLQALVDAYNGDTYRLLTALAALLAASVAYVDRATVEAHLERTLSAAEWTAVAGQLAPLAFDEQVGEAGTLRTDWIEDVLAHARVSGRRRPDIRPGAACDRRPS